MRGDVTGAPPLTAGRCAELPHVKCPNEPTELRQLNRDPSNDFGAREHSPTTVDFQHDASDEPYPRKRHAEPAARHPVRPGSLPPLATTVLEAVSPPHKVPGPPTTGRWMTARVRGRDCREEGGPRLRVRRRAPTGITQTSDPGRGVADPDPSIGRALTRAKGRWAVRSGCRHTRCRCREGLRDRGRRADEAGREGPPPVAHKSPAWGMFPPQPSLIMRPWLRSRCPPRGWMTRCPPDSRPTNRGSTRADCHRQPMPNGQASAQPKQAICGPGWDRTSDRGIMSPLL